MRNVTGIEQINDKIITHTKWDPRNLTAFALFATFTLAALVVVIGA